MAVPSSGSTAFQWLPGPYLALVLERFRQEAHARLRFPGLHPFFISFVALAIIGCDKLWALAHGIPQRLVTDSPYFYICLTCMLIGTQLFLAGFLGDLVSRSSSGRNDYQIEKEIRIKHEN